MSIVALLACTGDTTYRLLRRPILSTHDGNKWTAWTLMVLLLWVNGYRHGFTTNEGFDVVGVAVGTIDLLDSAHQMTSHVMPR